MSARAWGSVPDAVNFPRPVEAPAPAPVVVEDDADFDSAQAAEEAARAEVDTARRERDEAREALAKLRPTLPEAAARGLEEARKAQARIGKAEDRLRSAEELLAAMEAAYRPVHERAAVLRTRRLGDVATEGLLAKLEERDAADVELFAAFGKVAELSGRRAAIDREVLALHATAASYGRPNPGREVQRPLWAVLKTPVRGLPDDLRAAIAANL